MICELVIIFLPNMLQIELFISQYRRAIIVIQNLFTIRKCVFAPLIVLSSVFELGP